MNPFKPAWLGSAMLRRHRSDVPLVDAVASPDPMKFHVRNPVSAWLPYLTAVLLAPPASPDQSLGQAVFPAHCSGTWCTARFWRMQHKARQAFCRRPRSLAQGHQITYRSHTDRRSL